MCYFTLIGLPSNNHSQLKGQKRFFNEPDKNCGIIHLERTENRPKS